MVISVIAFFQKKNINNLVFVFLYSVGGERAYKLSQLTKCRMEFEEEDRLFNYKNVKTWFEEGGNTVPWSLQGHKGEERMIHRIQEEIKSIDYTSYFEPYNSEVHGISYSNYIFCFVFEYIYLWKASYK